MAKFKHYDYNQMSMVVINYLEQIQPGTFEFALHYLISEKLDLSAFHKPYKNDAEGRPAYDPAILLKIILFVYSKGITSSREIQWCCETNIIFKALSCDTVPHFTTIAHFVSSRAQAIEALFEQVLLICDQQGLLGHELFAIDGCKMRSNASKGTFKELEEKCQKLKRLIQYHLSEHQENDTCEIEESLGRHNRKTKTIQTLDAAANKIDAFLKQNQPRMGKGKRHQSLGKPKAKPLIPASEFEFDPVRMICICPAGDQISHREAKENERGQRTAYFEGRLLQCRHCAIKDKCMKNPVSANHRKGAGRQVSFALNDQRTPTYTDLMKHRVDSPKGKQIYSHRMSVVEPVFGNIGTNKGLSRFSLRGKNKVQGQWQLYSLVHNVERLANYGGLSR